MDLVRFISHVVTAGLAVEKCFAAFGVQVEGRRLSCGAFRRDHGYAFVVLHGSSFCRLPPCSALSRQLLSHELNKSHAKAGFIADS